MKTKIILLMVFIFNFIFVLSGKAQINNPFSTYFEEAYLLYTDIPKGILESVAYTNTHFNHIIYDSNEPESGTGIPRAYGVMGLTLEGKGVFRNNLVTIAKLSGYSVQDIINSPQINIMAFAKSYVAIKNSFKITNNEIEKQIPILVEISELPLTDSLKNNFAMNTYLYSVLSFLLNPENQKEFNFPQYQFDIVNFFGQENYEMLSSSSVILKKSKKRINKNINLQLSDYASAIWNPAASCNYTTGRTQSISAVTIHDTEGSYAGTISWFQNCTSQVSAHYVIRSSDGQVTQMVAEANKAWHVGNENGYTIGIEHEGYCSQTGWYTNAMYSSSANLVKDICNRNGIDPKTTYSGPACTCSQSSSTCEKSSTIKIKGHQMFPNQSHTDPGSNWDWAKYYNLINGGGSVSPPSNDECSNAITLTPSTTVNNTSGDIAGATQSYTASGCASGLIQDVWYKFTALATGTYTIRLTPSSSMDGIVEVRQGNCTGTVLGCADSGGGNGGIENLNVSVTNGTVYYVRVYEYNAAGNTTPPLSTSFNICVIGATTSECTITSLVPNAVTHGPASFSTTSGSDDIIVNGQANCNFNVTESCSWLTVTPMSGTTNSVKQAFINYSIDPNTTTSTRQCTFYVNGSPITITQNGCSFEFYPTTMNVPASGSTYNLDIYTSSPCSWNIQNNSSWAHPSQLSGTGYPTITVTVDPNTTCDTRTCTLTLSPGNQTHVITQPSSLIAPTTPTSVIASQMSIVNGQSSTLQVVGGALNSAPEWVWYTGGCGGTRIGAGSSIVVSPAVKTTYYVQASACGTSTTCKSITINNTTAVNEVSASDKIMINPNPTTGKFEITGMELLGSNCKIEIFNHVGKTIYVSENENFGNKISLDLSSYPVGMYIVKLSNNGVSYQKKVSKK